MDNEDAHRLSPEAQHERRRQVIRAYKRKLNKRQIACHVGPTKPRRSTPMCVAAVPLPREQTPVAMAVGGTRQKLSMIASVTNQGKARWMISDGAFNHKN